MNKITVYAPAKVNLYLDITGLRADGYHTIETIFQTVSLADKLVLQKTRQAQIVLTVKKKTGSAVLCPATADNIVYKAAQLFKEKFAPQAGVKIELTKVIPVQAGLGGGSSDAAATLLGLRKLFLPATLTPRDQKQLHQMALRLGADVPFFLSKGLAKASGVGEKIRPLPDLAKFWMVIVKPQAGLSTPMMYKAYDAQQKKEPDTGEQRLTRRKNLDKIVSLARLGALGTTVAPHLFNAFESTAYLQLPQVRVLKQRLLDLGALGALMSGSGSALFAIAASKSKAEGICRAIKSKTVQAVVAHNVVCQK